MDFEVVLPELGDEDDAVQTAKVSLWLADPGTKLKEGDDLLEITTDKAAFVVPCPRDGTLKKKCVEEDAQIAVGTLIAIMEI